jgi:hypothetical protein
MLLFATKANGAAEEAETRRGRPSAASGGAAAREWGEFWSDACGGFGGGSDEC